MATHPASTYRRPVETDSGAFFKVASMLLGLAVAVVGFFALLMWADSRENDSAEVGSVAETPAAVPGAHNAALPLDSFAGVVPDNAQELAKAHKPYDAMMPAIPAGEVVRVQMTLKDMAVEIAPGVKYNTWAFDGPEHPARSCTCGKGRRSR